MSNWYYIPSTIETYLNATKHFFLHFPQKHPTDIGTEDIEAYQHHMATERKVSNSYLNQVVNAVRYYYKVVLGDAYRVKFIERPCLPSGRRARSGSCHPS